MLSEVYFTKTFSFSDYSRSDLVDRKDRKSNHHSYLTRQANENDFLLLGWSWRLGNVQIGFARQRNKQKSKSHRRWW